MTEQLNRTELRNVFIRDGLSRELFENKGMN